VVSTAPLFPLATSLHLSLGFETGGNITSTVFVFVIPSFTTFPGRLPRGIVFACHHLLSLNPLPRLTIPASRTLCSTSQKVRRNDYSEGGQGKERKYIKSKCLLSLSFYL